MSLCSLTFPTPKTSRPITVISRSHDTVPETNRTPRAKRSRWQSVRANSRVASSRNEPNRPVPRIRVEWNASKARSEISPNEPTGESRGRAGPKRRTNPSPRRRTSMIDFGRECFGDQPPATSRADCRGRRSFKSTARCFASNPYQRSGDETKPTARRSRFPQTNRMFNNPGFPANHGTRQGLETILG